MTPINDKTQPHSMNALMRMLLEPGHPSPAHIILPYTGDKTMYSMEAYKDRPFLDMEAGWPAKVHITVRAEPGESQEAFRKRLADAIANAGGDIVVVDDRPIYPDKKYIVHPNVTPGRGTISSLVLEDAAHRERLSKSATLINIPGRNSGAKSSRQARELYEAIKDAKTVGATFEFCLYDFDAIEDGRPGDPVLELKWVHERYKNRVESINRQLKHLP